MLHLRVICPPERTGAVRDLLVAQAGATHVTVLAGIAVQPPGDVVEVDVAREATDEVLAGLCALGIDPTAGSPSRRSTRPRPTPWTPRRRRHPATPRTR